MGLKDFKKAEGNAKSAYEKAAGMKYRWAEGEIEGISEKGKGIRGKGKRNQRLKCKMRKVLYRRLSSAI
jgi:hypothetical protein